MSEGKRPSPEEVQKYLRGASYPAYKENLIAVAGDNKAPKEVLDLLVELPGDHFGSEPQVLSAVKKVR